MCGGGTLPFRPTCSCNANCPWVSSPVARNVSSQPLYQTDCSRDGRPLPNAMASLPPTFPVTCVANMDAPFDMRRNFSSRSESLARYTPRGTPSHVYSRWPGQGAGSKPSSLSNLSLLVTEENHPSLLKKQRPGPFEISSILAKGW